MNDLQSQGDIHAEIENLNTEAAITKKIFEEVGV